MFENDDAHRLNRRDFLRAAAASAGVFAAGGVLVSCERDTLPHAGHDTLLEPVLSKKGSTAARNPLRIPQTASPSGLTLTAAPGTADLGGGRSTSAWLYNGQFPGPTLVANNGDTATISLRNQLAQETITHWHGMIVDHHNDGHPHQAQPPGGRYDYDFPIRQRACLNWYHPHPHLKTGEQVYRGLAGAFILRDSLDTGQANNPLGLPSGAREVPLIIRDASFDSSGNLSFGTSSSGFFGNTPLVNGTLSPFLAVDRAVYRFRVLNGCNARVLRLALSNGAAFTLIGNEGGFLDQTYSLTQITISPGERLDLLVSFDLAQNASVMLRCLNAGWDLLEFRGTGSGTGGSIPALALPSIPALSNPVTTRNFSFDGMTRINGRVYNMDRIDFRVPFGQTERWVFKTNGNGPHPVHVHGAYYQVQSRSGGRGVVLPWERGWKDTVMVNDKETVDVLVRFDEYRGLYLLHCHQLAHEDNGMMANFEVY